jgi:DHA2 family methylenomycin A resistance protein-like MFS transporter
MGSLGVALGPVFGGVLVAVAGWRSIFLVNVPICALTVILLRRHVTESPLNPEQRPDLPGLVLGVLSLAGLTAGFITAGQRGWLSPVPAALFAVGLITGWLFVRAERRQAFPMLPLGLFRSRSLSGATGVGVIFNLVLYGSLLCLSLFLQQARHQSVLATGLLLLPMSLVVGIGSLASGRLTARFGPRPPILAGLMLGAAGAAVLATAGPATSLAVIAGGSVLLGLVSLAMPAMTAVVVGAAGPEHAGVAGGILNAARQSGGGPRRGPARVAARLRPRAEPAPPAGRRGRRLPGGGGPGRSDHPRPQLTPPHTSRAVASMRNDEGLTEGDWVGSHAAARH